MASLLRGVLLLFSFLYEGVVSLRNWAFDLGVVQSYRLPIPVISVGNLTAGGTGKTPVVQFLAQWLKEQGYFPGVITRGYKAQADLSKSHQVSDGRTLLLNSAEAGDEAYQLARNLSEIPVWIGANRFISGQNAMSQDGVDILIMDDGFQHRNLARNIDIVLIDALSPWGYGHVFPRGLLREGKKNLKRADLILITRSDMVEREKLEALKGEVQRYHSQAMIFETSHQPKRIWSLTEKKAISQSPISLPEVHLFCGLGNPAGFFNTANQMGFSVTGCTVFPDHYFYKKNDLEKLTQQAKAEQAKVLVTSEKDGVKLEKLLETEIPIWQIEIEVSFGKDEENLKNAIIKTLRKRD